MKMKELRWLFLAVVAAGIFVSFMSEPVTFGISQQWTNDTYRFAGGTHPVALTFAILTVVLYLLLMFAPPATLGNPFPGVFRRFVAFWFCACNDGHSPHHGHTANPHGVAAHWRLPIDF